ncbi:hypothetical protein KSS87_007424, partial [Heliosperma pusillum]
MQKFVLELELLFLMANGALVRVLILTDVTKYLYFKAVDGSFVFNKGKVWSPKCCLEFELAFTLDSASLRVCKYGLDDGTNDFIGHALALQSDDCYLNEPALKIVKRMK